MLHTDEKQNEKVRHIETSDISLQGKGRKRTTVEKRKNTDVY